MSSAPIAVPPEISAQDFIDDYVDHYRHRWFPVLDGDMIVGSIGTQQITAVDRARGPMVALGGIMRPASADDTVAPETSAFDALAHMGHTGQSRLMVARNDRLLGIVSSRDLLDTLSLETKPDRDGLRTTGPTGQR